MKKLYTLSLVLFACVASFAQTFYSENMGTPAATTQIADNAFQNGTPIAYSGTADVRATLASTGYAGASGGGNVFITNTLGKYFQIDGLDSSAYASADLQLTFGLNSTVTTQPIVEQSTDGANWTALTYVVAAAGWKLITIAEGQIASSGTLSLRFSQPDPVTAQFRIDDVKLSSVSASCLLSLGAATTECDDFTENTDTYTATIPFLGGGTATYGVTASVGTIGGDSPSTNITGNIIITNIPEGTPVTVGVTGGTCNLSTDVTAANCAGVNSLPFFESFDYPVGQSLGLQSKWSNVNTGDDISIASGNLSYLGASPSGNSIVLGGGGVDTFAELVPTNSGTIYYSYLINVTAPIPGVPAPNANGGYISGFAESSSVFGATVWTKRVDDTSYNFGIEVRTATGADTTWTPAAYQIGQTYMVVVGYMYGDGESDDMVDLWINPVIGSVQTAPLIMDSHTGVDLAAIDNFFFRQDTDAETPAGIQIDQLRIGTTWESVTDLNLSVGENNIAGLKMYPNPVSNGTLFIETSANASKAVVIYDVLGKQVVNTTATTNAVNVSNLNSGVYIVKITEEGKTATKKLVIR